MSRPASKAASKILRGDRCQARRAVILAIGRMADPDGTLTASYAAIAEEAGVHRNSAINAVNDYAEHLSRKDNGRTKPSTFQFVALAKSEPTAANDNSDVPATFAPEIGGATSTETSTKTTSTIWASEPRALARRIARTYAKATNSPLAPSQSPAAAVAPGSLRAAPVETPAPSEPGRIEPLTSDAPANHSPGTTATVAASAGGAA